MELVVKLDESIIEKYRDRSGPICFDIYWVHEDEAYPSMLWSDFGVVLLGWWINDFCRLESGTSSCVKFLFMDGPYCLLIEHCGDDELWITNRIEYLNEPEFRVSIKMSALKSQLRKAANYVIRQLASCDYKSSDFEALKCSFIKLNSRLSG